ncbi:MAG: hypoxanthine phosphoribosyltransferase [bacterium]|nr:hypoxanthine phosphoribosyltransferase [bacterium]
MNKELKTSRVLISKARIQSKVKQMARKISSDYKGKDLILVGVLRGSFVFMADLVREISIPVEVDFIAVASYKGSTRTSGVVRLNHDLSTGIRGRHVLLLEDIVDSGLTLSYLLKNLRTRRPASIEVCTLLEKKDRRRMPVPVKYKGFNIPDKFVVGYGLDHNQLHRNLPYISWIEEE